MAVSRVSVVNSFTTRNLPSGSILEGEYDSVIDIAEININLTAESLLVPADGMLMEYHYSNDGVNVAEIITAPLIITTSHFQKLQSEYNFFRIRLVLNTDVSLCSLSTIFKAMPCFEEIQNTRIRATNGEALTASNGALNVNLAVGEEIIVSGEVEVSNFPNIQKISASDGTALTVSDGGLNVNILNGETIVVSGDVIVQGIEPQFRFYATPATNTAAVYADGAQGTNANGGWLFINRGGTDKINWYVYANTADQASTAKKVSSIVSMYAVIYQKTLTVAPADSKNPFIAFYTLPEANTITPPAWYKNRYVFSAYSDRSSVVGMKLLYIGVDNPLIHPEITTRIQLIIDPATSTNTLAGGADEDLWLGTIGSSSNIPAGQYNFVFSEYGIDFTEEARLPTVLPIIDNKVQVSLATNAATESTLALINGKTPSLGQALAAASQPVVLTLAQVDLIKPLATQPISGSVGVTGALPAGNNLIGIVNINNTGIVFVPPNIISVSEASVGQWYKVEATGTTTVPQWIALGVEPYQNRIFKALVTGTPGTGTISQLQYNENVVVKSSALPTGAASETTLTAINTKLPSSIGQKTTAGSLPVCLPAEQLVLLSAVNASANVFVASQLIVGNWYKVETVDLDTIKAVWTSMGALIGSVEQRPPAGRVFRALNTGSGLSTFSSILYSENVKVSPTSLNFSSPKDGSLGNTGIIIASGSRVLRSLSISTAGSAITYVYIYDMNTMPTSGSLAVKFVYIVNNAVGIQIELNHLFSTGIAIRATATYDGTDDPLTDTFCNITYV